MANGVLKVFQDEYDRNARLKPSLLVILPIAGVLTLFGFTYSAILGALAGPLATVGFTILLAHIARDFGQRKQECLYALWGGKPSITKLRHRDASLNAITKSRYHHAAELLLKLKLPSSEEEAADPAAADVVYDAYSNLLLERTRDHAKFRLIFEELISYGFRRNLWGMKPLALTILFGSAGLELVALLFTNIQAQYVRTSLVLSLLLDIFLLLCWTFIINPEWVKRGADAYADRLLAASEALIPAEQIRARSSGA